MESGVKLPVPEVSWLSSACAASFMICRVAFALCIPDLATSSSHLRCMPFSRREPVCLSGRGAWRCSSPSYGLTCRRDGRSDKKQRRRSRTLSPSDGVICLHTDRPKRVACNSLSPCTRPPFVSSHARKNLSLGRRKDKFHLLLFQHSDALFTFLPVFILSDRRSVAKCQNRHVST